MNGERVALGVAAEGDMIELGHTFFTVFSALAPEGAELDLDSADLEDQGHVTLDPSLGRELGELTLVAATDVAILIRGESGAGKEGAGARRPRGVGEGR